MTSDAAAKYRAYLLGDVSEEERERIELELLSGENGVAAIEEAEDGLIEDYLAGVLAPAERERFARHFLAAPEHARSLTAARWLREQMAPAPRRPERARTWAMLAAAASIAIVLGGLWLAAPTRVAVGPRPSPTILPARGTPTEAPFVRVATLTLSAGRVMSAGTSVPHATLTRDTARLRLELVAENPQLDRCRVSIADARDNTVWQAEGLRAARVAGGAVVTVEVPATALPDASLYKVTLAAEPSGAVSGRYDFELRRE
jgi:hypothetical protein